MRLLGSSFPLLVGWVNLFFWAFSPGDTIRAELWCFGCYGIDLGGAWE